MKDAKPKQKEKPKEKEPKEQKEQKQELKLAQLGWKILGVQGGSLTCKKPHPASSNQKANICNMLVLR